MKKIYKPENGISGYAPYNDNSYSSTEAQSVYYSAYNSDDIKPMLSLIKQKKVLSTNESVQNSETVDYREMDVIITNDGSVFSLYTPEYGTDFELKLSGSIKIPNTSAYEGEDIWGSQSPITFQIQRGNYIKDNDYNYVDNCTSPLYHHRDSIDSKVYGNYIRHIATVKISIKNNINRFDGKFCKLVINFNSGLRFEKILTYDNCEQDIFIDNRYLLYYGNINDPSTYNISSINSYSSESSSSTATSLQRNLKTSGDYSLCKGYIEYSYNNKNYRREIEII